MRRDKLPRSTQATTAAVFSSFVVDPYCTLQRQQTMASREHDDCLHQFWRFMPNDRPARQRRLRVGLLVFCIAAESTVALMRYEPDRRTDHIMVAVASDKVETKERIARDSVAICSMCTAANNLFLEKFDDYITTLIDYGTMILMKRINNSNHQILEQVHYSQRQEVLRNIGILFPGLFSLALIHL